MKQKQNQRQQLQRRQLQAALHAKSSSLGGCTLGSAAILRFPLI